MNKIKDVVATVTATVVEKPYSVKDIAKRAIKTAVQCFLAIATVQALTDGDVNTLLVAAKAAAGGAISVLWNTVGSWANS